MRREAHKVLEDLPGWCNIVIGDLLGELTRLDGRIAEFDTQSGIWPSMMTRPAD